MNDLMPQHSTKLGMTFCWLPQDLEEETTYDVVGPVCETGDFLYSALPTLC